MVADRIYVFGRAPANKWRILNARKLLSNFLMYFIHNYCEKMVANAQLLYMQNGGYIS